MPIVYSWRVVCAFVAYVFVYTCVGVCLCVCVHFWLLLVHVCACNLCLRCVNWSTQVGVFACVALWVVCIVCDFFFFFIFPSLPPIPKILSVCVCVCVCGICVDKKKYNDVYVFLLVFYVRAIICESSHSVCVCACYNFCHALYYVDVCVHRLQLECWLVSFLGVIEVRTFSTFSFTNTHTHTHTVHMRRIYTHIP